MREYRDIFGLIFSIVMFVMLSCGCASTRFKPPEEPGAIDISHSLGKELAAKLYKQDCDEIDVIERIREHIKEIDVEEFVAGFVEAYPDKDSEQTKGVVKDLVDAARVKEQYADGEDKGRKLKKEELQDYQLAGYVGEKAHLWSRPQQWAFGAGFVKGYGQEGSRAMLRALWVWGAPKKQEKPEEQEMSEEQEKIEKQEESKEQEKAEEQDESD